MRRFMILAILVMLTGAGTACADDQAEDVASLATDTEPETTDDQTDESEPERTDDDEGERGDRQDRDQRERRPSTTTTTTTTTTVPPPPQAVTVEGSGDNVVPITRPDGPHQATLVSASYNSGSNFIVQGGGDLLVNTIGGYGGTTLLTDPTAEFLEVSAAGPWSITFSSIASARPFILQRAEGIGDDVLLYDGPDGIASITHVGESNFIVEWISAHGRSDLLVNEIGGYVGRVVWDGGLGVLVVQADGSWSVTIEKA
jgi:hypothetical protein